MNAGRCAVHVAQSLDKSKDGHSILTPLRIHWQELRAPEDHLGMTRDVNKHSGSFSSSQMLLDQIQQGLDVVLLQVNPLEYLEVKKCKLRMQHSSMQIWIWNAGI